MIQIHTSKALAADLKAQLTEVPSGPGAMQWYAHRVYVLRRNGNLSVTSLHQFETQHTALVRWPAQEKFTYHRHWGGEEILVLEGEFCDEHGRYDARSWVRSPHLSQHSPLYARDFKIALAHVESMYEIDQ